jgi:hypothetical protein
VPDAVPVWFVVVVVVVVPAPTYFGDVVVVLVLLVECLADAFGDGAVGLGVDVVVAALVGTRLGAAVVVVVVVGLGVCAPQIAA